MGDKGKFILKIIGIPFFTGMVFHFAIQTMVFCLAIYFFMSRGVPDMTKFAWAYACIGTVLTIAGNFIIHDLLNRIYHRTWVVHLIQSGNIFTVGTAALGIYSVSSGDSAEMGAVVLVTAASLAAGTLIWAIIHKKTGVHLIIKRKKRK